MEPGLLLLIGGAILAGSAVIALGATRLGVPTLVAFLVLGMLLGSDGPGGIEFDDAHLARTVGVLGLAAILFEGGLSTSWRRLRQVAVPASLLSTVGIVASAALTGAAAYALFPLSWLQSVLLGAVVASTDAAAVFATLRYTTIRRRLARLLEAETGLNDPFAIALTLGFIQWIEEPGSGLRDLIILVIRQLGLGVAAGVVFGMLAMSVFARLPQSVGPFAPVVSLAAAALSFGAADVIGGSGFLSVYLVGLAVGSTPSPYRRQLVAFHEGLAFLAQVVLFVMLGLLVFPSQLGSVAGPGVVLAILLVVAIRPASVWLATAFSDFTGRERMLLGWAGLRGAIPIVLATFVLSSNIPRAETIFNAVFFVVIASVLIQGTTLEWVARRLGLVDPAVSSQPAPLEVDAHSPLELVEFTVAVDHAIAGAAVRELGLPRSALIAVVTRGDHTIPPRGGTTIMAGDQLFVLAPRESRAALEDVFARWRRRV
jgi:potassium/hydrogen antiporter